jgi:hypothetical protein
MPVIEVEIVQSDGVAVDAALAARIAEAAGRCLGARRCGRGCGCGCCR